MADLVVRFVGDTKALQKSMGTLQSRFEGLGSGLAQAGKVAAIGLGVVAGGAALATAALIPMVLKASDLRETIAAAGEIFGDARERILAFGRAAPSIGLTQNAAIQAATQFGTLFNSIGLTADAAAGMSLEMVQLAVDLSSFMNVPVEEALAAIKSGLIGEAEPMRKFGVLLSEGALQAKALELGLEGATGELSEQEKVQARAAIIIEQTTAAHGDQERTAGSLANVLRRLSAMWDELQIRLGEKILPIVEEVARGLSIVFNEVLNGTGLLPGLAKAFLETEGPAKELFATALQVGIAIRDDVIPAAREIARVLRTEVIPAVSAFVGFLREIFTWLGNAKNRIGDFLEALGGLGRIGQLGQAGGLLPRIPGLQGGGIVRGPTLAMLGEGGPEAVVPLNRASGLGITINVAGSLLSQNDLIEAVRRGLLRRGQSLGPLGLA